MSDQTGVVLVLIVWKLDLQLPMQSVPITTNVGSNTTRGKVYLVQQYVIKFVSVSGILWFHQPIKLKAMI